MSSEKFKKIREQLQRRNGWGITDAQIHCARKMGVILRTWQRWETGEREPRDIYLQLARERLGKKQQPKK